MSPDADNPVESLEDKLDGYHAYHATRADLLRRLGSSQKSRAAYDKAIELADNIAEAAYLTHQRDQLGFPAQPGREGGARRRSSRPRPTRDR